MAYENNDKRNESVYSNRVRAGKRRTYFFDVRETRSSDYFLTITESRKRANDDGYDRHKIFLYKEDFNKFAKALNEAIDHVKTELMPDFDFDAFNHDENENGFDHAPASMTTEEPIQPAPEKEVNPMRETMHIVGPDHSDNASTEEADKW
ncbi:MAG: DUF3276 family protein [Bacteroidetes bacterium]|nr:DUF3276 family protein [Bacteroidota bacterium]